MSLILKSELASPVIPPKSSLFEAVVFKVALVMGILETPSTNNSNLLTDVEVTV